MIAPLATSNFLHALFEPQFPVSDCEMICMDFLCANRCCFPLILFYRKSFFDAYAPRKLRDIISKRYAVHCLSAIAGEFNSNINFH